VGPNVTVLARIDAKPHPSAVNEVISLLLGDQIEQKLVLSDESNSITDSTDSNSVNLQDGWIAKRRRHNNESSGSGNNGSAVTQELYFNVAVAVKQNNILATAFHPELTNDLRWHR